jgi:DNA-binding response OmpR family regulator
MQNPCTVLIVEDLADLRDLLRRLLLSRGYQVICADSAEEALKQAAAAPIDLLLTDWQLPGMNGRDLAVKLLEAQPGLRVLLTSGRLEAQNEDLSWLKDQGSYLTKPYDFDVMFDALSRLSGKAI